MISFKDWQTQQNEDRFRPHEDPHVTLEDTIAILSNLEPKEIEDCKDLLLDLQKVLETILTGGN